MFFISDAMAQTAGAQGGDLMSSIMGFLPMILIFVVFWFFMIRPQQKRQKEHANMIAALTTGDEVMTAGGIVGRIVEVGEEFFVVQIASVKGEPVTLTMQRMAIQALLPKGTVKTF